MFDAASAAKPEETLRELEAAREYLRVTLSSIGDAVITTDVRGGVTYLNPAAESLTGWSHALAAGRPLEQVFRIVNEETRATVESPAARTVREGVVVNLARHTLLLGKNGAERPIDDSAAPIRTAAGEVVGAVLVFRDVSERVAMENRIKEQAEALADEARRKDEFLAMLSHELRNPLAPIRSAVHVLRLHDRTDTPIQRRAREIIERQVVNLTKLVSDLLEVSRVVTGRIRLDQQIVDVNQIVQHAVDTVRPLVERRRHELVVRLCAEPIWANADAMRMEEVFVNLLDNAVKYTDEGGRIEVECELHREHVLVRVRDNGIGIDAQTLPRVFDLFAQAERSLERAAGGLGIGLAVAHRLVSVHGGTIEAHSPPNGGTRGSELIVRLPLMLAPEQALPAVPAVETSPTPAGLRALVVDDNLDQVLMLASALRHKGYSVKTAHTGPDGLKVAEQWQPDIVLLDIGLPGLDGYEVARRLSARPSNGAASHRMRLIALTGYGSDADIALAREAGFEAHLTKPCDLDELEKLMAATPARTEPVAVRTR